MQGLHRLTGKQIDLYRVICKIFEAFYRLRYTLLKFLIPSFRLGHCRVTHYFFILCYRSI